MTCKACRQRFFGVLSRRICHTQFVSIISDEEFACDATRKCERKKRKVLLDKLRSRREILKYFEDFRPNNLSFHIIYNFISNMSSTLWLLLVLLRFSQLSNMNKYMTEVDIFGNLTFPRSHIVTFSLISISQFKHWNLITHRRRWESLCNAPRSRTINQCKTALSVKINCLTIDNLL